MINGTMGSEATTGARDEGRRSLRQDRQRLKVTFFERADGLKTIAPLFVQLLLSCDFIFETLTGV